MNFVVLTNGNDFCSKLLRNFKSIQSFKNVKVLVEIPLSLDHFIYRNEKKSFYLKVKLVFRFLRHLKYLTIFFLKNIIFFRQFVFVREINHSQTLNFFNNNIIDVVFLAGMSILKKEIINSINIGVYNCHPALVPNVRGVDVIYHSVINLIPLIISIHKVDEGIDTGCLIKSIKVPKNLVNEKSYDVLNDKILNFASYEFSKFINYYLENKLEDKSTKQYKNLQILPYCKKIENKNYDLFFQNLKKLYK